MKIFYQPRSGMVKCRLRNISDAYQLFYQGLDGSGADRDEEIQDPHPVLKLKRKEGRRPAILLGLRDGDNDTGVIKVYARRLTRPGTYVRSFYLLACAFQNALYNSPPSHLCTID